MGVSARIKSASSVVLGLAIMLGMMIVAIALLRGAASFSLWILQWTLPAFGLAVAVTFLMLVPAALIPPTRPFAAIGFMAASMIFSVIVWLWGMAFTYLAWGLVGVVVGIAILGVGVVPLGMLAALVHGEWGNLAGFVIMIVPAIGCRLLSYWLGRKLDEQEALRLANLSTRFE